MRMLAKTQPCGCVVCTCEDDEKCHGCGAKHCGTHPIGEIPDPVYVPNAALDVLAERQRQIDSEGRTPEHDDQHGGGQLAEAAACYAIGDTHARNCAQMTRIWPWAYEWWKPGDRRRMLVKAGALIIAEIERLDRIKSTE